MSTTTSVFNLFIYSFFLLYLAHLNTVTRIYSRSFYFSNYWYLTLKLSIFNSGILNPLISRDIENDTPHVPSKIHLNSLSSRLFFQIHSQLSRTIALNHTCCNTTHFLNCYLSLVDLQ